MVARLRRQGLRDPRVLAALAAVPRERFVPEALASRAYEDARLPIGEGQTISHPWTVGRLAELLQVSAGDKVLEVGTGSGYQAAVLAAMGLRVFSLERRPALARSAAARLRELGFLGVTVKNFDGTYGWAAEAPFDGIVVTAGGPEVPPALLRQLRDGARLVMPIARDGRQRLLVVTRQGKRFVEEDHGPASFVPLIGRFGYPTPPGRS
ncbi:MAG: protein-L-isoaspartate(D-aspartate) O-methyltransferase [Acidobacteria bacterium]|nr:MAG: protein-L-isoaspartate(D-aspartate) O-methyltransferase [Acidobacteriota bacterium]